MTDTNLTVAIEQYQDAHAAAGARAVLDYHEIGERGDSFTLCVGDGRVGVPARLSCTLSFRILLKTYR